MEKFEKRIKLQRDMERFNIEKSIEGTPSFYLQQDIDQGVSEQEILEKARSGIYANTAENRKKGRVGQKYGPAKKEDSGSADEKSDIKSTSLSSNNEGGYTLNVKTKDGSVKHFRLTREETASLKNSPLQKEGVEKNRGMFDMAVEKLSNSSNDKSESAAKGKHIGDMNKNEKLSAAKKLGIENPESLSSKELDKQLIDKNIEKQLQEFVEDKSRNRLKGLHPFIFNKERKPSK